MFQAILAQYTGRRVLVIFSRCISCTPSRNHLFCKVSCQVINTHAFDVHDIEFRIFPPLVFSPLLCGALLHLCSPTINSFFVKRVSCHMKSVILSVYQDNSVMVY